MPKRVCVIIDDDVNKKLRLKQATEIKKTSYNVSFSMVINETLRKNLK